MTATGPRVTSFEGRFLGDPTEPCPSCGGSLDPDADPDTACGCDPAEEEFPSPWIWTDDGASPGPGHPDDVGGSTE